MLNRYVRPVVEKMGHRDRRPARLPTYADHETAARRRSPEGDLGLARSLEGGLGDERVRPPGSGRTASTVHTYCDAVEPN
jgi:hypothetical protein